MSEWTHICGGFEVGGSPFSFKGEKPDTFFGSGDAYFVDPKAQLEVLPPEIKYCYTAETEYNATETEYNAALKFDCVVYSLPRIKKYIDNAIKFLPSGENNKYDYTLTQTRQMSRASSSDFSYPCEEKQFKKVISQMYSIKFDPEETLQDIENKYKISPGWTEYVENVIVGISQDVRYCKATEMLEALEKMCVYLLKHDMYFKRGCLEWSDESTEGKYRYLWRAPNFDMKLKFGFYKLDAKTNKILWAKEYLDMPLKKGEKYSNKDYIIKIRDFQKNQKGK